MKSPVVMSSTLVSSVFKISLNTRPISFLDTLDTAQISTGTGTNDDKNCWDSFIIYTKLKMTGVLLLCRLQLFKAISVNSVSILKQTSDCEITVELT